MKITKFGVVASFAVVEGIVIVFLLLSSRLFQFVVAEPVAPELRNPPVSSPFEMALRYESRDEKFEELVEEYPGYVNRMSLYIEGMPGFPILASCALARETNYVRILIEHGADVEPAITALESVDANEEVELVRSVLANSGGE